MEAKTVDHGSLIDRIGGTVQAARLFEVRPQAVTQWRRTGIPRARLMYLKSVRPELFAAAANADAGEVPAAA